jgi:hypothetical protein
MGTGRAYKPPGHTVLQVNNCVDNLREDREGEMPEKTDRERDDCSCNRFGKKNGKAECNILIYIWETVSWLWMS